MSIFDKKLRIIYLCEHLIKGSHADNISHGIKYFSQYYEEFDYSNIYLNYGKHHLESKILSSIIKNNIDVLIINLGSDGIIDPQFLIRIKQLTCIKIVIMFPDSEHNFEEQDRYYAQCADLSWLLGPAMISTFEVYGFNVIGEICLSENIYKKPDQEMILDIDVSFVGGLNRSNRKEYLDFLKENKIQVVTAGDGGDLGFVSDAMKNEIISRSKIHLNFSGVHNTSKKIFKRVRQNKARNIEATMLSTFLLSENAKGIDEVFDIGTEIDIFEDKFDLLEKIKYYLNNEQIRKKMAHKAYLKAQNQYTPKNTVSKVLTTLYDSRSQKITDYFDDDFKKWFVSKRIYHLVRFLLTLKVKAIYGELLSIIKYRNLTFSNFYYDIPKAFYHTFKYYFLQMKFFSKFKRN